MMIRRLDSDMFKAGESLRMHPEITTVNEAALPGLQRALQRADLFVPREFPIIGVAARALGRGIPIRS